MKLSKSDELKKKESIIENLEGRLAVCRGELDAEKKNIKKEYVDKLVYYSKCDNCHAEAYKKAKSDYEASKEGYHIYLIILCAYSLFLSIFQTIKSQIFFNEIKGMFSNILSFGKSGIDFISGLNLVENKVGNICLLAIILILAIVGIGALVVAIFCKVYCNEYIWHWGTVAEVLISFFIFVNLDEYISFFIHCNLLLIYFIVHVIYLITITIIIKKRDSR